MLVVTVNNPDNKTRSGVNSSFMAVFAQAIANLFI